jgi:hypothetical protein
MPVSAPCGTRRLRRSWPRRARSLGREGLSGRCGADASGGPGRTGSGALSANAVSARRGDLPDRVAESGRRRVRRGCALRRGWGSCWRADWTIMTIRERSRRYIQYDPDPPHLADEPIARRCPADPVPSSTNSAHGPHVSHPSQREGKAQESQLWTRIPFYNLRVTSDRGFDVGSYLLCPLRSSLFASFTKRYGGGFLTPLLHTSITVAPRL